MGSSLWLPAALHKRLLGVSTQAPSGILVDQMFTYPYVTYEAFVQAQSIDGALLPKTVPLHFGALLPKTVPLQPDAYRNELQW